MINNEKYIMKNFKKGLLAVALITGIAGAFATKAAHAAKQAAPTYNWTSTSIAPSNPSSMYNGHTIAEAELRFGCVSGTQDCADGDKVSGSGQQKVQLKFN
jgi:hypothetical protein